MDFSLSHLHHVASGVPQGSVLGPTNPRFTYKISDHNIEAVSSHTDLGVVRSFKGSDVNTCAYIYKAFVRPILEFAGAVWDTVLLRDRNLVESVQRRATHRLELFNLTSFSERRLRGDLIVTFRILHGLMGTNLMHLYHLSRSNLRGHSFKLHKEPFKTTLIASKCSMIAGGVIQTWTQENVDAVRKPIIEDRHVTYRAIEASLKTSKTSIQKKQKTARVNWCQKTLDRFNFGNSKNLYSIVSGDKSWIYSGHIATIPLNEQRPVTAGWYTTICLPKVITELRKINPERRIILHQDNASSNTAQKTRQYLTEENVEFLDHPPYSPDLSPSDFFTFPKLKNRLRGQRFQSPEEAMCINLRGEYFEKQ
ncbi:unnamed protein product [Acanthoscelides obtectus]|uniref:Transposase n=1 Tax=Acanthoscelides obtectus TaxID=200917 RepID=A0A9P0PP29_ACAOB|nr:unnamed protein product [Acanthoscelides obtectus]CAK1676963.1 Histone-lysine N-methyltransferase SETMAR [Acanthoscelides obtectus]